MIKALSFPLGELQTNTYILWDEDTSEAVIVDPAASGDFINDQLLEHQLSPTAIWLTHGHFDHVMGLLEVSSAFKVPIWLHQNDTFLLKKAADSARHWLQIDPPPVPDATSFWEDGDILWVGSYQFKVIHTPGHTPGSVSLYNSESELLISGDTLFQEAVGRTDFSYASDAELKKSLRTLFNLPDGTTVLPGHGQTTTIGSEMNYHSYLKTE